MHIAEDLLLLLVDNAAARPALDDGRRQRLLSAAVLLDLAYDCRIRPAQPSDPAPEGTLVALQGDDPVTPVADRALRMLGRHPVDAGAVIAKLRGKAESELFEGLERSGLVHSVLLYNRGFRRQEAWTLTDRTRPARARATILASLTEMRPPDPTTAAIVSLLYFVDGLGALLSFDERGWEVVGTRAGDIASGGWLDESATDVREINLAVTTAAVRVALGGR
jgi:Golgi phosphoprotein 3 (GPP34)